MMCYIKRQIVEVRSLIARYVVLAWESKTVVSRICIWNTNKHDAYMQLDWRNVWY
jgi:hypothetical protein